MEKEVIIVSESWLESIVKDVFTFGLFAGLLYFNHAYLSSNWFVDTLFIVTVMLFIIGRNSKSVHRFSSRKEAVEYLAPKPQQGEK